MERPLKVQVPDVGDFAVRVAKAAKRPRALPRPAKELTRHQRRSWQASNQGDTKALPSPERRKAKRKQQSASRRKNR